MAGCCDVDPKNARDLTASRAAWLLWYAPIAVIIAGSFWIAGRNWLWAGAFAVMGTGCVVNASRCQRLHCYFTGPLFLAAAGYAIAAPVWFGLSACQSIFADCAGSRLRIPMCRKTIRTLLEGSLMVAALFYRFELERDSMELTHLFDLALRYDGNAPECPPPGGKEGRLLGSGEGSAEGALLSGKVRWSNYERTLAPGLCRLQVPGVIQTDDGAEIQFEAHGHAMQSDSQHPNLWASAGAFLFTTEDPRYSWLAARPVVWAGEFDAKNGSALYRLYAEKRP